MYEYQDLDNGQIRILTLNPSSLETSVIECSLAHHSLESKPTFEALSYTWGKKDDRCPVPILLEGHSTLISTNLEAALRTLRYSDKPRKLWIDALCINQYRNDEKSHQITMMGDIFELADKVIIWLGPKSEDSDLAMSALSHIATSSEIGDLDHDEWMALENLFKRPWFSRIWVLQEFKRARHSYFHCGNANFCWNSVETPFGQLWGSNKSYDLKDMTLDYVDGVAKILSLAFIRVQLPNEDILNTSNGYLAAQNLVRILRIYGASHNATIEHDKIYGLLGLSSAFSFCHTISPAIDYDVPFLKTYKEWARFLIVIGRSLDLLYISQRMLHDSALPSWVPDWRNTREDLPLTLDVFRSTFEYTGLIPVPYNNNPLFEDDGTILCIQGFIVTTLTSELYKFSEIDSNYLRRMFKSQSLMDVVMVCVMMGCRLKNVVANDIATIGISKGRKQVLGLDGSMGLVPNTAQYGDIICVLANAAVPFLLRRVQDKFLLIGDAYFNTGVNLHVSDHPNVQTFKLR